MLYFKFLSNVVAHLRRLRLELMLLLPVVGYVFLGTVVRADSIVIGQINPPDMNYASGVTFDGEVGPFDLATLLGNWGPCP